MKHICKLIIFLALIVLPSCQRTLNVVNLEYFQDSTATNPKIEVFKHGYPFNGEAWNKEENFQVQAYRGTVSYIAFYHNSGELAIKDASRRSYYDKTGMKIPKDKFNAMYRDLESQFDSLKLKYVEVIKYGGESPK